MWTYLYGPFLIKIENKLCQKINNLLFIYKIMQYLFVQTF